MKKLNYLLLAVMTMLFAASCSQDDTFSSINEGDKSTVSFTLEIPESGPQSRAVGDGTFATQLFYAVYDLKGKLIIEKDEKATYPHTVSISLAKDQEYKIAFWAQADGAPYTFEAATSAVTVDYDATENNDESLDAFFHSQEFTVGGNTIPVELKRPFAQLNVGTADLEAAGKSGVVITKSSVTITNAAEGINLLTGTTTGTSKEVTFAMNDILTGEKVTVNEKPYDYLSMSYFLVDAALGEQATAKLSFEFSDDNGKTIKLSSGLNDVPVQRNYRTNIIGNLLTDMADFDVTVDDEFDGDNDENYNAILRAEALAAVNAALNEKNTTDRWIATRNALTNSDLGLDLSKYNKLVIKKFSEGANPSDPEARRSAVASDLSNYQPDDGYNYEDLVKAFNAVVENRLAGQDGLVHVNEAVTSDDLDFETFLVSVLTTYERNKDAITHEAYNTATLENLERVKDIYEGLSPSQKSVVIQNLFQHTKDFNSAHVTEGFRGIFNGYSEMIKAFEAQMLVAIAEKSLDASNITTAKVFVEALNYKLNKEGINHGLARTKLLARLNGDYAVGTLQLYVNEGSGWTFHFGTTNDLKIKGDIDKLSLKLSDGDGKHLVTRTLRSDANVGAVAESVSASIPYVGSSWDLVTEPGVDLNTLVYEDANAADKVVKEIPAEYTLEATVKYKNGIVVTKSTNRYRTLNPTAYFEATDNKTIIIELPIGVYITGVENIMNWRDVSFETIEGNKAKITLDNGDAFGTVQYKVLLEKGGVKYERTIAPTSHIKQKDKAEKLLFMEAK